jgi:hypothetical protein
METAVEPPTVKLCSKCSVLQFDDSHFGSRFQLPSGQNVLTIHEGKDPALLRPSSITTPLDYLHHDKLPDLPGLVMSSEAGCDFCRSLRAAIQMAALRGKRDGKIKIALSYLWHRDTTANLGLRALVADLSIETSEEEQKLFHADRAGFLAQWNMSESDVQVDEDGTIWRMADFVVFTVEGGSGKVSSAACSVRCGVDMH